MTHHADRHTDVEYHSEHVTHPELDHRYDDQHDVEPVHFHEHKVKPGFDHPGTHAYHPGDFEPGDHGYEHWRKTHQIDFEKERKHMHEEDRARLYAQYAAEPVHGHGYITGHHSYVTPLHEGNYHETHDTPAHEYNVQRAEIERFEQDHTGFYAPLDIEAHGYADHGMVHDYNIHGQRYQVAEAHLPEHYAGYHGADYELGLATHHTPVYGLHGAEYGVLGAEHGLYAAEYGHHGTLHHDTQYDSEHVTHPELDHKYDDQHDVEPVHFHEHAVLPALPHPDSQSYHWGDFEPGDHGYEEFRLEHQLTRHDLLDHEAAVENYRHGIAHAIEHEIHHLEDPKRYVVSVEETGYGNEGVHALEGVDTDLHHRRFMGSLERTDDLHHITPAHHFIIEEPMVEESRPTFHGREMGYMYRVHDTDTAHGHLDFHDDEPLHGVRHGETFGSHHIEDHYEVTHRPLDKHARTEHFVEPIFEYGHHAYTGDRHFEPPHHHPREVEYEIDGEGHVH